LILFLINKNHFRNLEHKYLCHGFEIQWTIFDPMCSLDCMIVFLQHANDD